MVADSLERTNSSGLVSMEIDNAIVCWINQPKWPHMTGAETKQGKWYFQSQKMKLNLALIGAVEQVEKFALC